MDPVLIREYRARWQAVAHRGKDLLDIEGILRSYPDVDRSRIERWVREFAAALDMPELWDDIVPLLH